MRESKIIEVQRKAFVHSHFGMRTIYLSSLCLSPSFCKTVCLIWYQTHLSGSINSQLIALLFSLMPVGAYIMIHALIQFSYGRCSFEAQPPEVGSDRSRALLNISLSQIHSVLTGL